ncbi:MAG: T9SS type A sorting domain-containing protein [bacterium]
MRYLFTFLLLFCLSIITLTAQDIKNPDGDEKILGNTDLVYQIISYNTDGKVYRNTYDYTTDLQVRSIIQDTLHNGNWVHITKTTYTVDSINYIYNQTDSVWYENQWLIYQSYTSKYNSNWQLLEYLDELFFGDKLYRAYRITHILDSADNVLISLDEDGPKGVWSNVSRTSYKYDKNKNVLDSLKQNWRNDKWVNDYNYIYTYDERGNKLSSCINEWFNDQWIKYKREAMTYYSTNKLHTYFYEKWEYEKYFGACRITYTYDDKGNLLTDYYEGLEKDKWKNCELNTNTYNTNGKILTKSRKVWKQDNWQDSTRESYVYDSKENELSHLIENWVANHWVNSEINLSSYDLKGNVLTDYSKSWNSEQWVTNYSSDYSYNDNGILLVSQQKVWNNQAPSSIEIVKYNDSGKVLSEVHEYWDDGKLSNSTRHFFNYDANDNFISGTCEALESGEWVHSDGWFPFVDSRNKTFVGGGYKVEVTYKTISPVKENIFDVNLFLTCSPNPSAGQLNINYTLSEPANTSISISNISGIEVANISDDLMRFAGSYTTSYDTSKLIPGTYFITLTSGNKSVTRKIQINY